MPKFVYDTDNIEETNRQLKAATEAYRKLTDEKIKSRIEAKIKLAKRRT
jgi:hypothetical protein